MIATQAEAHLEWHRNSGIPVGLCCPWDACDPADLEPAEYARLLDQARRNKAAEAEFIMDLYAEGFCEHGMSALLCQGPGHYGTEEE